MTPKQLGGKLHRRHNGTDAIYAAGSTLFAGRGVAPETAQKAIDLLEKQHRAAKTGRFMFVPGEIAELSALIKALRPYAKRSVATSAAVQEATDACIKAAMWSSTDEAGDSMDLNYGPSDITAQAKRKMAADVKKFVTENADAIGTDYGQAGRDFWLTRNGHGSGFWDGDWEESAGKKLTAASKRFGEQSLYVSRKKVHVG